jgi:MGT family glycosyltransferase
MRVLVYTSPGRGHLYPVMDAALALKRRGHFVHVRTLADELSVVAAAGLEARALSPAIEALPIDDWQASNPRESVGRALKTFVDRGALEIPDLREAIADTRPDVLLIDTNCWGAQAVAEASTLPWATWHPYPLPTPSVDAPPFGPGFKPARGALGRLRDRLLRPLLDGPVQKVVPALNTLRRGLGLAPVKALSDVYSRPPLLFHLTAEPFEYPRRDWSANVRLVGPGLWSPPSVGAPFETGKPVVLVTCSTEYQQDGALIEAALAGLGDDPDLQLVCTTGGVDPALFKAPPNVVLRRFVPHAAVLPNACAVVCHGGMGITQRALAAKVPVCVVPWGRDQMEVARRADECRGRRDAVERQAQCGNAEGRRCRGAQAQGGRRADLRGVRGRGRRRADRGAARRAGRACGGSLEPDRLARRRPVWSGGGASALGCAALEMTSLTALALLAAANDVEQPAPSSRFRAAVTLSGGLAHNDNDFLFGTGGATSGSLELGIMVLRFLRLELDGGATWIAGTCDGCGVWQRGAVRLMAGGDGVLPLSFGELFAGIAAGFGQSSASDQTYFCVHCVPSEQHWQWGPAVRVRLGIDLFRFKPLVIGLVAAYSLVQAMAQQPTNFPTGFPPQVIMSLHFGELAVRLGVVF